MAHLFQVGAGSGGMPVLDMLCRDPRIVRVTLVEPDVFKPHNVDRHVFPLSAVGRLKAELARGWLLERRADLEVDLIVADLLDPFHAAAIEAAASRADIGVCAADNESAKYHFDALMRRFSLPWTLGEVLSGGIGGFIHAFIPDGPCYGCVASHLKRSVAVDKPKAPDYSQPGAALEEAAIPASKASIEVIAALHALLTLQLLEIEGEKGRTEEAKENSSPPLPFSPSPTLPFTSLLFSLQHVPDVFAESFRPHRFRIARSPDCLICRPGSESVSSPEELDRAVDQALGRLGHV